MTWLVNLTLRVPNKVISSPAVRWNGWLVEPLSAPSVSVALDWMITCPEPVTDVTGSVLGSMGLGGNLPLANVTLALFDKFSSWIFKIANNAAIDHLRRRELDTLSLDGSPHAETPEAMQATALQIGARQESPLDAVEAKELGGAIEAAIGRLRPEYRSCILLRHVEGRAYEEIAEILDLPLGTVKTYIHRARNELRLALAHLRE